MRITDVLEPDCVRVPMKATAKEDAIREMVDILVEAGKVRDPAPVCKAIMDREAIESTGIGNEIAIPHGASNQVRQLVAVFGMPAEPMEFGSLDGRPVRLMIMLVSPPGQSGPHLRILSRIARLLHNETFRTSLLEATTADELIRVITEEESQRFSPPAS